MYLWKKKESKPEEYKKNLISTSRSPVERFLLYQPNNILRIISIKGCQKDKSNLRTTMYSSPVYMVGILIQCKPKCQGGLGIYDPRLVNLSLFWN